MNHRDKVTDEMSSKSFYQGGAVPILYLVGFIARSCTLREEAN